MTFRLPVNPPVDRTGQTMAGVYVIRRAASVTRQTRWCVRCSCGGEHIVTASHLRTSHDRGETIRCKACQRAARESARAKRLARGLRPKRGGVLRPIIKTGSPAIDCPCASLPWRRPKDRPCKCGGVYEPEQFDARSYVAELPRPDARVLPHGGPR